MGAIAVQSRVKCPSITGLTDKLLPESQNKHILHSELQINEDLGELRIMCKQHP